MGFGVDDILQGIRNLEEYSRMQMDSGIDVAAMVSSHAASVRTQIRNLPRLTVEDGVRLTQCIADAEPWRETSARQDLMNAINEKVLSSSRAGAGGAGCSKRGQQKCDSFVWYLTCKDWEDLRSTQLRG